MTPLGESRPNFFETKYQKKKGAIYGKTIKSIRKRILN